jgi:hypothetical protein
MFVVQYFGVATYTCAINYRVFRAQADWTFVLLPELPAKELRHLPRKMPHHGNT